MRVIFCLTFISLWFIHVCRSQTICIFPADNDLHPKEYASQMTSTYTRELDLNNQQKDMIYNAVYRKKEIQDSLFKNGIHVESSALWALYNSLDDQFKQFLTENKYKNYEILKTRTIYRVKQAP